MEPHTHDAALVPVDIDPQVRQRICEEAAQAGEILILDPVADAEEAALAHAHEKMVRVVRQEAPADQAVETTDLLLKITDRLMGIYGPDSPEYRSQFQPQRAGLVDAAAAMIAGAHQPNGPFCDAPFDIEPTQRLTTKVAALQGYVAVLARASAHAEAHLSPLEARLYKIVAGPWKILRPVLTAQRPLRGWAADYYEYMTKRHQKGAATRKDRQALVARWKEDHEDRS